MPQVYDRVKETTTTTGTGNLTLAGAVAQFLAFSDRYAVNAPFYYAIVGQTGTEWEVGRGHITGATTLVRELCYRSSNADAFVNLSAGTKNVLVTIPSRLINDFITNGKGCALAAGLNMM